MSASDSRQVARVLIVEQDEAVGRICAKALQHDRFEVKIVASPTEAWKTISEWRPQMYLVGDEFDECLGLEFCGQLRGRTNAPIMVLSSSDSTGFLVNLLDAGVDDIMVRPFAGPLLQAKVHSLMRRSYRYSVPPMAPRPNVNTATEATSNPTPVPTSASPATQVATVSNGTASAAVTAAPKRGISLSSISTAPVTPEAVAPDTNFNSWPRCEACGYIGPNERFEVTDASGTTIRACPACNAVGRMRVPKRK